MAEGKETRMGWLAKYGVPSLALSVAVFVFQQQQQTFDRVQRITADGWLFYSNGRTDLQYAGDAQHELALLKVIGYAFPNIFCDVRRDMYERAWSAEPRDPAAKPTATQPAAQLTSLTQSSVETRQFLEQRHIDALVEGLKAYSTAKRANQPNNLIEAWFPKKHADACPSLIESSAVPQLPTEEKEKKSGDGGLRSAGASTPDTGASKPAKDMPAAESASSASPAPPPPVPMPNDVLAGRTGPGAGAGSGAGPSTAPAAPSAPAMSSSTQATTARMAQPDLHPASQELMVYFHIRDTDRRDASVADNARVVLSAFNYRVIRKVARIPAAQGFPARPEVRFFGAGQEADAAQLARYLDYQFQDEGLHFTPKAIGETFPTMEQQNIEVWVPDP